MFLPPYHPNATSQHSPSYPLSDHSTNSTANKKNLTTTLPLTFTLALGVTLCLFLLVLPWAGVPSEICRVRLYGL